MGLNALSPQGTHSTPLIATLATQTRRRPHLHAHRQTPTRTLTHQPIPDNRQLSTIAATMRRRCLLLFPLWHLPNSPTVRPTLTHPPSPHPPPSHGDLIAVGVSSVASVALDPGGDRLAAASPERAPLSVYIQNTDPVSSLSAWLRTPFLSGLCLPIETNTSQSEKSRARLLVPSLFEATSATMPDREEYVAIAVIPAPSSVI